MFDGLYLKVMWAVDFEYSFDQDGHPSPLCLVARDLRTGHLIRQWKPFGPVPPYPVGPDSLFVCYSAQAEISCHMALGWKVPARILDLCAEYSDITSGLRRQGENRRLTDALKYYGLDFLAAEEKKSMQQRAIQGDPWTDQEIANMLDYCQTDVDRLERLLPKMLPFIRLNGALYRGRYMTAIASMEWNGVPLNMPMIDRLWANEKAVVGGLRDEINAVYGFFDEHGRFKLQKFDDYCKAHGIKWPKTKKTRKPVMQTEAIEEQAEIYPGLKMFKEAYATLKSMRITQFEVHGGRNRAGLRAFGTKTRRNAPSSKDFIFGLSKWMRHLIAPGEGMAIAYIDLEQAEFGIAAALSGDPAMWEAYMSSDCYLAFARQAGEDVPDDEILKANPHLKETDSSLANIRALYKTVVLGIQYGQTAFGLALKLKIPVEDAQELIDAHRRVYHVFWKWIDDQVDIAIMRRDPMMVTKWGWHLHINHLTEQRTLQNFPMQAGCGEIFRLAVCLMVERGIKVCAPVHDAVLIEAPIDETDGVVTQAKECSAEASRAYLGRELRTDVKVIRHPDHMKEKRGEGMWNLIQKLLVSTEQKLLAAE
jgi:DNA polymerase I